MTDVASDRTSYFEKRSAPLAEGDWPTAPIFATDGKHVCIEEHGSFTVLPMPTVPFLQTDCFVWKRNDAPARARTTSASRARLLSPTCRPEMLKSNG